MPLVCINSIYYLLVRMDWLMQNVFGPVQHKWFTRMLMDSLVGQWVFAETGFWLGDWVLPIELWGSYMVLVMAV